MRSLYKEGDLVTITAEESGREIYIGCVVQYGGRRMDDSY